MSAQHSLPDKNCQTFLALPPEQPGDGGAQELSRRAAAVIEGGGHLEHTPSYSTCLLIAAVELPLSPIENEPQNQEDKNDDQDDPEDAADRKKNCHRHSRPFP